MLCGVAIVACSRIGPATTGNIAQETTTADSLIEDPELSPLDKVTVDQERELHKPNRSLWYKLST